MLRRFELSQIYVPSSEFEEEPHVLARPFEEADFAAADDVKLHGWFFPADDASARKHLTILLLHGNGGNISHRLDFCEAWLELGVNVFLFDYRGYGKSGGSPEESGTYLDAQAAYRWVTRKGLSPQGIIALGKSLGGGVASELALRETLGGLILQNTYTSIPDVGARIFPWLPVRWLCRTKYHTLSKLPRIKLPLLVAHTPHDEVIPFEHAKKNFAAANEPKMFLELRGNHTGTLSAGKDIYLQGLDSYLRKFFV